jgi:hypothetical protein
MVICAAAMPPAFLFRSGGQKSRISTYTDSYACDNGTVGSIARDCGI